MVYTQPVVYYLPCPSLPLEPIKVLLYTFKKKLESAVNPLFKLLLIEDDTTLFNEIKDRLAQWSYDIYGIGDFSKVVQEFTDIKPDLVIIDIQLPKFDGFHWCRMIRAHSNVPIIFLSSRDHPTDMVMSMQLEPMILSRSLFISMYSSRRYRPPFAVSIITIRKRSN